MSTLLSSQHSLYRRLRTGADAMLVLLRSPDQLIAALRRKGLVPAALLLGLLLVPTVLLPLSEVVLGWLYPPVKGTTLFGLLNATRENELLTTRITQASVLIWFLAGAGVVGGLLLYAPRLRLAATEAAPPRQSDPLSGALPERYQMLEELGRGAMGVVYRALDTTLGREVALKELPALFLHDSERRERFRREAFALAKLSHPGIVQIYDLIEYGDRLILVMELVKGGDLEQLIAQRAPFPLREACRMAVAIGETLDYVHRNQIIHRDLKPANILIDADGRLKVTDFGLARLLQNSGMTMDGSIMGSPFYMSPEQAAGKLTDRQVDFYALGAIFYQLLTGQPPFTGEPAAVLVQQLTALPRPPQEIKVDLDPQVAAVVLHLLHKDPAERLADATELARRLRRFTR